MYGILKILLPHDHHTTEVLFMDTYYAPVERADTAKLNAEIAIITESPVMTGLLQTIGGLIAVVN